MYAEQLLMFITRENLNSLEGQTETLSRIYSIDCEEERYFNV
jgi:hypothetical protein